MLSLSIQWVTRLRRDRRSFIVIGTDEPAASLPKGKGVKLRVTQVGTRLEGGERISVVQSVGCPLDVKEGCPVNLGPR